MFNSNMGKVFLYTFQHISNLSVKRDITHRKDFCGMYIGDAYIHPLPDHSRLCSRLIAVDLIVTVGCSLSKILLGESTNVKP